MILTGQLDSPFVRRVAIALHIYALPFEHNVISAYDDFDELLALNPLGKVPALQLDDGTMLADSTLILDHLDRFAGRAKSLWPATLEARAGVLAHIGVAVGLAEKAVEFRTETVRRPADKVDGPRVDRILAQIAAALRWLETHTTADGFIAGDSLTHADIASGAAVTFIANKNPEHLRDGAAYSKLLAHTERCEALAAFKAAPFMAG
ncbi:MAG: glutathione S-transferase family protein [Methyloligellaceae bacterium]